MPQPRQRHCKFCDREHIFVFRVEYWIQEGQVGKVKDAHICDICLQERDVDPDALVRAIIPELN